MMTAISYTSRVVWYLHLNLINAPSFCRKPSKSSSISFLFIHHVRISNIKQREFWRECIQTESIIPLRMSGVGKSSDRSVLRRFGLILKTAMVPTSFFNPSPVQHSSEFLNHPTTPTWQFVCTMRRINYHQSFTVCSQQASLRLVVDRPCNATIQLCLVHTSLNHPAQPPSKQKKKESEPNGHTCVLAIVIHIDRQCCAVTPSPSASSLAECKHMRSVSHFRFLAPCPPTGRRRRREQGRHSLL